MIKFNAIVAMGVIFFAAQMQGMTQTRLPKITLQTMNSNIPNPAQKASDTFEAGEALMAIYGVEIDNDFCVRMLHKERGEGFWHQTITQCDEKLGDTTRYDAMYLASGEYVQPHYQGLINKEFTITCGGCHIWFSNDEGKTWKYHYYGVGKHSFPGNTWCCFMAGVDGLCMDMPIVVKRFITWLTADKASVWGPDLEYTVKIQDLREATLSAIGPAVY